MRARSGAALQLLEPYESLDRSSAALMSMTGVPSIASRPSTEASARSAVAGETAEKPDEARGAVGSRCVPDRQTRTSSGRAGVVRREHHAKRRQHDVKRSVRKRQRLRVGFLKRDRQAFGLRATASVLEQRLDVVGGRGVGEPAGGGQRAVAVAATSSTLDPAEIDRFSHNDSPTICRVVPMIPKSPDAQVAR